VSHLNELKGLGGWLVLVGIVLMISTYRLLFIVLPKYPPIFTHWKALTNPESELYYAFLWPLLLGEAVINLGLTIAFFYLIYLYLAQKRLFPPLFIAISVFYVVHILLNAWATTIVVPDRPIPDIAMNIGRTLLNALIWIPYMRVSRRVRATFVE